ncbi:MAG TPA: hypothetical protein VHK24_01320, partial [Steroidobacter sp.]|nr:hypothetical protein [Steroidobacter sp.]
VDGHVHELVRWNGNWVHSDDLTRRTDTPIVAGTPMAFADAQGMPHVVFRDGSGQLYELYLSGGDWLGRNITSESGGPLSAGNPHGFFAAYAPRVVYRNDYGQLYELTFWEGHWNARNLSTTLGTLPAASDPVGYVGDGLVRIIYRATDDQLHELKYDAVGNLEHMDF